MRIGLVASVGVALALALILLPAAPSFAQVAAPPTSPAQAPTPAELSSAIGALAKQVSAIAAQLSKQTQAGKPAPAPGDGGQNQGSGAKSPAADPPSRTPLDTLILIFVAGLMGMVGQGARTIVGLKQVSDRSETPPSEADEFDAARILVGLMIGFVAGVAALATSNSLFGVETITASFLLTLAAVGYIGVDAIEGLTETIGGRKLSARPAAASARASQPVKTTFRQNQIDAFRACVDSGLSPEAGIAFTADVMGESLRDPSCVTPDPSRENPDNKAHGIVQWSDDRARLIERHFGQMPEDMSVTAQTKAALWEMQTYFTEAWEAMTTSNDPNQIVKALVYHYEMPADMPVQTARRQGYIPQVEAAVGYQSPAVAEKEGAEGAFGFART